MVIKSLGWHFNLQLAKKLVIGGKDTAENLKNLQEGKSCVNG
jgi:hypothetical protein